VRFADQDLAEPTGIIPFPIQSQSLSAFNTGGNVISKVILRGAVRRVILRKVAGRRIHAACGFRVSASLRAE